MELHRYSSDRTKDIRKLDMDKRSNKRAKYRVKELIVSLSILLRRFRLSSIPFCNFKPVQFAANPEFSNVPRHGFALAQFVSRRRRNRILTLGRVGRGGKREREGKSFRRPLEDRDYDSLLG